MDWTLIAGIAIILLAYGLTCAFIIKSKRIIEKISQKRFESIREIEKELSL